MTLIELLVTIVILVTLLAAVLPAVSPNNDGRRIREASRQLVSLFAQAQAQAARDGRTVGVGFSDPDGDGMALEAYILAEPRHFSGFDVDSSVLVTTGPNGPNTLCLLTFGRGVGMQGFGSPTLNAPPDLTDQSDWLPPSTFRVGDIVEVGGELFQIVPDDLDGEDNDMLPDTEIPEPAPGSADYGYLRPQKVISAFWLTRDFRPDALLPQGGNSYRIRRRPSSALSPSRTTAETIQLPRGVGIDLDPAEGNVRSEIMFSPNGSMDAWYVDGIRREPDDVFILLGRIENANPITQPTNDIDYTRYDFRGTPTDPDDDELAERRREVNLFNADSRWVTVSAAGRIISNENGIFDPRTLLKDPNDSSQGRFVDSLSGSEIDQLKAQKDRFRYEAQRYARQLEIEGGG
jgi:type II secretory pathway pseudopilin PulG